MAVLRDRKRDLYAKTQLLRDEANAPEYLESAGDALIKELAKKQLDKTTTLEEQLQIHQEFEKGSELKPWKGSGLATLQDFQELLSPVSSLSYDPPKNHNLESLKARTGLSRHELELGLVEKPESQNSALYRFALGNRRAVVADDLVSKLERHPINRLKAIEEEVFGEKNDGKRASKRKRRGKRKRTVKRKEMLNEEDKKEPKLVVEKKSERNADDEGEPEENSYRPSLWDVKDMRKFCNNVQQDCKMQNFYTIREGKIMKLNKSPDHG